jgi:carboxypeptidase T
MYLCYSNLILMMKWLFFFFVLCSTQAVLTAQQLIHSRVRIDVESGGGVFALAGLGLEVDHGQWHGDRYFTHYFSSEELVLLDQAGFEYVVEVPDAVAAYKKMIKAGPPPAELGGDRNESCDQSRKTSAYTTPVNYQPGTMGGYQTYSQMMEQLHAMHLYRPDLITDTMALSETIVTYEGRRLHYLRISDNPGVDENEPEVLYTSLHHAREPNSLSEVLFFMWYLLENYDTDPEIKYIVDETDLFFVPCVNPDGYVYNETTDPTGGGMWRKNRRLNAGGTTGVDLNRNYGFNWGYDNIGSSGNPNSATYRGTAAFSEPETQVVRNLCNAHDFVIALNHHTYSDILVFPWGYTFDPSPDRPQMDNLATELVRQNGWGYGAAELLYVTNGDSDDWMYGETTTKDKIFAHTPELGPAEYAFWPPPWKIDELNKSAMHINLASALSVHVAAAVDVLTTISSSETGNTVPFRIRRTGLTDGPITVSLTALTNNVVVDATPIVYNLPVLGIEEDAFAYTPSASAPNGDLLGFVLSWDNGLYTYTDTFFVLNGTGLVLAESETFLTGFSTTGQNWSNVANSNGQPAKRYAITQSPNNLVTGSLVATDAISLPDTGQTWLSYDIKYHAIYNTGRMKIYGGQDGTDLLCGDNMMNWEYNNNEPAHQGMQPEFIRERINISDFNGQDFLTKYVVECLELPCEYEMRNFRIEYVRVFTGSQDFMTAGVVMYPNPANTSVSIKTPWNNGSAVQVWGIDGVTYYQDLVISSGDIKIDVSDWPAGIYAIQVKKADGQSFWGKLQVK